MKIEKVKNYYIWVGKHMLNQINFNFIINFTVSIII